MIFDTTLRDGEQSPGATLNIEEKIEIARQLSRLGVDIIEAGFPIASPGDFEAVRQIALTVGKPDGPVICGLARANAADIERAWEAVQPAAKRRIHVFLATSDIHLKHKLRMTREEALSQVREMVAYAKRYCDDIEFSPEDAGRSDPEYLYEVLAAAIECGATTINIPDTVGYTMPEEFGGLIRGIMQDVPGVEDVVVSAHCHDDLGLATANTLAAIRVGARQAEVTVNGIGERAGNTSLEEIVMGLYTRQAVFGLTTNIDTTQIYRTSRMVSSYTGLPVQPNKAIVGDNAFAHEAGIHQDGILKNPLTYEIMTPQTIGLGQSKLVLGKHSGRHAFGVRLQELGYHLSQEDLNRAFRRFKELCDKKKVVSDADIEALVADELYQPPEIYALHDLQVTCGRPGMPTATVRIQCPDGQVRTAVALGTGPVDAAYSAIRQIVRANERLLEFSVQAITEGIDALGQVTVRIQGDGELAEGEPRIFGGHGADTDIIVASAKAYMSALNKLIAKRQEKAGAVGAETA